MDPNQQYYQTPPPAHSEPVHNQQPMQPQQQLGGVPTPAPAQSAPAPLHSHHSSGPISDQDVKHWKEKANHVFSDVKGTVNEKSAIDATEWQSSFFGCCNPISTCLMTYCCSCVVFGKTHHRLHKDPHMKGYEPINTSCLLFLASAYLCLHWIPESMQRSEIRKKYHLKGSCMTDIAIACCCALCDIVQQDKEVEAREKLLASGGATHTEQYSSPPAMGQTMEFGKTG